MLAGITAEFRQQNWTRGDNYNYFDYAYDLQVEENLDEILNLIKTQSRGTCLCVFGVVRLVQGLVRAFVCMYA